MVVVKRVNKMLVSRLYQRLRTIAYNRKPDFIIGNDYCRRWWLIPRNRFFNIYLHQFLHSDDDRALHDHPWFNMSLLLWGSYIEHTKLGKLRYTAGNFKFRMAHTPHRIELIGNECWTLFITGPVIREWGFHCPNGWRPWKQFVDDRDSGKIGRGCE